jgi:hypothetical protein
LTRRRLSKPPIIALREKQSLCSPDHLVGATEQREREDQNGPRRSSDETEQSLFIQNYSLFFKIILTSCFRVLRFSNAAKLFFEREIILFLKEK